MKNRFQFCRFLVGIVAAVACSSCARSVDLGVPDDLRLQHWFRGGYRTCQELTIGFGSEGRFACRIYSTDFVGHFSDVVWGTYTVDSSHVFLKVDELNADNLEYRTLPMALADSLVFSPSGDLIMYFGDDLSRKETSVLSLEKAGRKFPTRTTGGVEFAWFLDMYLLFHVVPVVTIVGIVMLISFLAGKFRKKNSIE